MMYLDFSTIAIDT